MLRIRIPELNEQRRKEMVKVAHKYAEDARVAVRHVRRDGFDVLKRLLKEHAIAEDDGKRQEAEVQKATDEAIKDIDQLLGGQGKGDHAGLADVASRPRAPCRSAIENLRLRRARRRGTSPSSWTATAAGRRRAACRARGPSPRRRGGARAVRAASEIGVSVSDALQLLDRELEPPGRRGLAADGPAQALHPQRSGGAARQRRARAGDRRPRGPCRRHRRAARRGRGADPRQSRPDAGRSRSITAAGRRSSRPRAGWRRGRRRAARSPTRSASSISPARCRRSDIPDPDLIIRTSGEQRLSNFLLWQAAYAEFVFLPIHWPDFDRAAFEAALDEYYRARAALRRTRLTADAAAVKSAS